MKEKLLSDNEEVRIQQKETFLTDYRLIKEKSFLGNTDYKDIQLDKIESIEFNENLKIITLAIGIISPFLGYGLSEALNHGIFILALSITGILLVGYALFTWNREYKVKSSNQSINVPSGSNSYKLLSEMNRIRNRE